ncbi:hypothetical protein MHYP_G00286770 [Metynnis hypsauchen]
MSAIPRATVWNPEEKPGMAQPPPYQDYSASYNPAPGYPNQTGYQGQPYGTPYQGQGQGQGPYFVQPAVTMQTTVNVGTTSMSHPLPDYLGYSIFTLLCCCLPLGIAALVFSIKTRDANMSDNRPLAESNSRIAFILNNTALGIGIALTIAYIVLIVVINTSY